MQAGQPIFEIRTSVLALCGVLAVFLVSACSDFNSSNGQIQIGIGEPTETNELVGCADTDSCFSNPDLQIGGDRPAQVLIPSNYTTATRYPLIILLHGFGAMGQWIGEKC